MYTTSPRAQAKCGRLARTRNTVKPFLTASIYRHIRSSGIQDKHLPEGLGPALTLGIPPVRSRVVKWVWQRAKNGFQGGARSFED